MTTRPGDRGVGTSTTHDDPSENGEPVDDTVAESPHLGAVLTWFGAVTFVGVLAVAASTDSLKIWRTPEGAGQQPTPSPAVDDIAVPVIREPLGSGVSLTAVAVVLLLAIVALLLLTSSLRRSPFAERIERTFGWGELAATAQDPLPDVTVHDLGEEIGDARNALLDGDPRNGIVACWMRLERGALDAGLPRWAAETADEYSRRVVTSTSVDPTPLNELAELYREARFSGHRLSEQDRDRASAALGRISDGLVVEGRPQP